MKVWVLSTGEYSGWAIAGIFSDKGKAEAIRSAGPADGYNDLDEYELDVVTELMEWQLKGFREWYISFDSEGNVVSHSEKLLRSTDSAPRARCLLRGHVAVYSVRARTLEEAIKIASDTRAQYLAVL